MQGSDAGNVWFIDAQFLTFSTFFFIHGILDDVPGANESALIRQLLSNQKIHILQKKDGKQT